LKYILFIVRVKDLEKRQKEFLKNVMELGELPEEEDLRSFLSSKGYTLYECKSCGKLIFHDGYEFWNLSECCDDNSKLVDDGLLCEVCYSKTFENLKHWIFFKPTWFKEVDFRLKE